MNVFLLDPANQDFAANREAQVQRIQKARTRRLMILGGLGVVGIPLNLFVWTVAAPQLTFPIMTLIVAFAIISFPLMMYMNSRILTLYRTGQIVNGTLTSIKARNENTDYTLRGTYEGHNDIGATFKGRFIAIRNDLRGQPLPTAGTPMQIVYLHNRRHFPL